MRTFVGILLVGALTSTTLWAQQPLAITRVLLYKNGMAYVVRSGELTGPVSLTFHPEDMNDVLKSFTAWNPQSNELYTVGYTAGIPSSHLLSRFPFTVTAPDTGLGGFLLQVKGADLRLDHGGRTLEGKLVAIQQTDRVTAPQTSATDYRMTLLTRDGSLQTVWLSDVRSVEFVDQQLREQLRSYLEVLSSGRQDVTREISVYPVPQPGPVRVAYLQQFPLWKTSYRIDLGAQQTRIQGWAQIDNPTGEAWENVTVSLVSGAPVSFTMNLYDPLYTQRASVAVPGGQVAAPRQYEAAVSSAEAPARVLGAVAGGVPGGVAGVGRGGGAGTGSGSGLAPGSGGSFGGGVRAAPPPAAAQERVVADMLNIAPGSAMEMRFAEAAATRVEEFYEYTFPFAVRIGSRQSALLPFLQKTLNAEKLSIFNANTDRGNPRLGARLENSTDLPLEAGPVTFFQDSRYTGEAVLDYLPRGEKALVSFGVDHDIQIARRQQAQPETTSRITISKGIAVLFHESVLNTTYEIRNKGQDSKTLVIEHPRLGDRTLEGIEPFERTDGFHRFRVALDPQQETAFPVAEVVARRTTLSLQSLTRPQLTLFAGAAAPPDVRRRLGQIVDLQERVSTLTSEVQTTQASIDTLFRDQERLRENLKALGTGSQDQEMRSRYLDQLRRQEDQIDAARTRIDASNAEMGKTQAQLSELISTFAFGE